MFGEKTQRIAELKEAQRRCDEEHGPWINLAKEVASRALEAEATSTMDFGSRVGLVVDAMVPERRSSLVLREFDALPQENRWQILADLFGDEKMRDILARRREALTSMTTSMQAIETLAIASRATGRLDITTLPADSDVTLQLYAAENLSYTKYQKPIYKPDRSIRAIALGLGEFQVITDNIEDGSDYDDAKIAKPDLSGHAIVRFGTAHKDGQLMTTLYREAPIKCVHDGQLEDLYVKDTEDGYYDISLILYDVVADGVPLLTKPISR